MQGGGHMIFATALDKPAMFLMLTAEDVQTLREGRTLFVDERATKGHLFNHVILSLHKTQDEALRLLKTGQNEYQALTRHEPRDAESVCSCCAGIMLASSLFEDCCIVCWAMRAKKLEREAN